MSGVGSSTSSSINTTNGGTLGDVPPVTFPGVASGIDYNSIIEKYTAATLQQEAPLQTEVNNLNSANTEVLKLQSLLGKLQDSLSGISDPSTFQAYVATPSDIGVATTSQVPGALATPGTYTILSQTPATSTTITSSTAANGTASLTQPMVDAGLSITPTNGSNGNGTLTINGVQIHYDVNTDTLDGGGPTSIVSIINAVYAQTHVTITDNGNGTFTLTSDNGQPIALGSPSDSGNLLQVLHLDTAQLNTVNSPTGGGPYGTTGVGQQVTSSVQVGGINPTIDLDSGGNAGFSSSNPAVTSGFFTINGVQITVNAANQSVNDVLAAINQSTAGVNATFDTATNSIVLTSSTPGPTNIVLGSATDTSNFLVDAGLAHLYGTFTTGNGYTDIGATPNYGTQADVVYSNASGTPTTVYSSSNDFTNIISGIDLHLTAVTSTGYTVNVASNAKPAETAIASFVTAYNNVINELNKATAAPVIQSGTDSQTGSTTANQTSAGGPLYNNFEISQLRDQLISMVSGFVPSGSDSYNSLSSLGLTLDTAYVSSGSTDATDANDSDTTTGQASTSNSDNGLVQATSGQLATLDTTTFEAALAADPSAVSNIFTTSAGFTYQIGSYLTDATGLPTILSNGLAGTAPPQSMLNTVEDTNALQIDALKQQITLINQEANMQADSLRQQFTASETQIAELQALQGVISSIGH